ncbi:MAG: N-acetylmuramoyl-L-alanine amidase [Bacteroidota bacterium]
MNLSYKKIILSSIICCCFYWTVAQQQAPSFYQTTAMSGDGVYSLLRRYHLADFPCNLSKFYSLNNLKTGARLAKGKSYSIPIFIYRYDGKSIRTTIGISDWDKAVRIQEYNNTLLEDDIRQQSYAKSRVLWVPYHELNCEAEVKKYLVRKNQLAELVSEKQVIGTDQKAATNQEAEVKTTTEKEIPKNPKKQPKTNTKPPITGDNLSTLSAKNRNFPIFGSKYAYTPLKSNKLKGKVFYLVAGHGGPDPGAVGYRAKNRLCEDEYAYDVALRLCRNLITHGATAYMITRDPNDGIRGGLYLDCDEDEVVWGNYPIERGQKARLFQRSNAINELYDRNKKSGVVEQTVIVVHVDSRAKQQIDLFFYHHPSDTKAKAVAKRLQSTMKGKYQVYRASGQYFGTVTGRDLHMLREVKAPSVYIELGNIKHDRDQQRIVIERNRQLIADWLLEGLMK